MRRWGPLLRPRWLWLVVLASVGPLLASAPWHGATDLLAADVGATADGSTGCGGPDGADLELDTSLLAEQLARIERWHVVPPSQPFAGVPVPTDDPSGRVDVALTDVARGDVSRLPFPRSAFEQAAAAHGSGAEIWIAARASRPILVLGVVGTEVTIIGDCVAPLDTALHAWHEATARALGHDSEVAALRDLAEADEVALDSLARFLAGGDGSPSSWSEIDPSVRVIDPEDTPASELAGRRLVAIALDVPPSWLDLDAPVMICPRTASGWGTCGVPEVAASDGVLPLDILALPEESVALWLVAYADIERPIALLGELAADRYRPDRAISVGLVPDVRSVNDVRVRAAEGTPLLRDPG